jgi:hypothetical protein
LAVIGIGSGLVSVHLQTWFQARVDRALLARAPSVLMSAAVGLIPFSYANAGFFDEINLTLVFVASGALLFAVTNVAALTPAVRAID